MMTFHSNVHTCLQGLPGKDGLRGNPGERGEPVSILDMNIM